MASNLEFIDKVEKSLSLLLVKIIKLKIDYERIKPPSLFAFICGRLLEYDLPMPYREDEEAEDEEDGEEKDYLLLNKYRNEIFIPRLIEIHIDSLEFRNFRENMILKIKNQTYILYLSKPEYDYPFAIIFRIEKLF